MYLPKKFGLDQKLVTALAGDGYSMQPAICRCLTRVQEGFFQVDCLGCGLRLVTARQSIGS